MKHIAGNTVRMLAALFGIFLFIMSVGPYSAEAADSSVTFTVE
jgi:hypothetical protein